MLKTEEQEIDGLTFKTVQFPAMYGFALLTRLAKCVGPALSALGSVGPDVDAQTMAPAMRDALSSLDPDEAQRLVLEILKQTSVLIQDSVGGRRVEFTSKMSIDEVFSGRLKTLFKAVGFAIRVNFADFMPGSAAGQAAPVLQAAK